MATAPRMKNFIFLRDRSNRLSVSNQLNTARQFRAVSARLQQVTARANLTELVAAVFAPCVWKVVRYCQEVIVACGWLSFLRTFPPNENGPCSTLVRRRCSPAVGLLKPRYQHARSRARCPAAPERFLKFPRRNLSEQGKARREHVTAAASRHAISLTP